MNLVIQSASSTPIRSPIINFFWGPYRSQFDPKVRNVALPIFDLGRKEKRLENGAKVSESKSSALSLSFCYWVGGNGFSLFPHFPSTILIHLPCLSWVAQKRQRRKKRRANKTSKSLSLNKLNNP